MDRNMFKVFPFVGELLVAHFANKLGRLRGREAVPSVSLKSGYEDEAPVAVFAPVRPALVAMLFVFSQTLLARKSSSTSFTVSAALIVTG